MNTFPHTYTLKIVSILVLDFTHKVVSDLSHYSLMQTMVSVKKKLCFRFFGKKQEDMNHNWNSGIPLSPLIMN